MKNTFSGSGYQVYIASASLKEETVGNIHIARRWDFGTMLDEAALFINHGGQNSIVDGLLHGVNNAGVVVSVADFNPVYIRDAAEQAIRSKEMADSAAALGKELAGAGGIEGIVREIK